MAFTHKKINSLWFVEQTKHFFITVSKKTIFWLVVLFVFVFWVYALNLWYGTGTVSQKIKNSIIDRTTNAMSTTFGKEMIKDAYGNVNVLLVGYGWSAHQWGFLADSIIIASYDTKLHSVSLISLPRDLVVNMSGYINKVNSVMAYKYNKTKDIILAAKALAKKAEEITSLPIPYYALVDFNGFAGLVDSIWGIDITVPKKIYDTTYPWPNRSYTTFSLNSGFQHLDGAMTLKYARSRHSTSDFSRSQRQQQIIKSIMEKIANGWALSVSSIKSLYSTYTKMINTNIELEEMVGLLKYSKTIPSFHSFWYTMECSNSVWRTMQAACFLYPVNSAEFNGMSGLLPIGASMGKISYYDYLRKFANQVTHYQWYLNDNVNISLFNATDKKYLKKFPYRNGISNDLAVKLKRYWFKIQNVDNASYASTGTVAVIYGTGDYKDTFAMLSNYITIDQIQKNPPQVDVSGNVLPPVINIYIGNTYLDRFGNQVFNYYQ